MTKKLVTKYGNASFDEKKGYRITSRKEGNFNKMLHRLIWEDHYGKIPQNCCIIFKDGDKTNFQLSNLELKKKQDSIDTEFGKAYLNKYGYMYINKTPLHHLVWENHYNKKVPKGYHIHHKDENKTNNDINNLQLISASEHAKLHAKTRNNTGFRVSKQSCDRTKQGFTYRYIYRKNGKQKRIESVNIDKLKEKVLSKNLEWKEL